MCLVVNEAVLELPLLPYTPNRCILDIHVYYFNYLDRTSRKGEISFYNVVIHLACEFIDYVFDLKTNSGHTILTYTVNFF